MSQPETSSGSKRAHQTYEDQALSELLELAAKFQRLFHDAMRSKESGFCVLRVEYTRGKVTAMHCSNDDCRRPVGAS